MNAAVDHLHDVTVVWRDGTIMRKRAHYSQFHPLRPIFPLTPSEPEPAPEPTQSAEFIDLAAFL